MIGSCGQVNYDRPHLGGTWQSKERKRHLGPNQRFFNYYIHYICPNVNVGVCGEP